MSDYKQRRPERKQIDTNQVVRYLSKVFANATEHLGKQAVAGCELHDLQVDFAHYVNDITRGPTYQVSKVIADCNHFIDGIVASR